MWEVSIAKIHIRTSLHYACCSNSLDLVTILLGQEPELVHTRDSYGRIPLHYLIWNSNPNLLEIGRKILDAKSEVDAEDDEGMTALQYAADSGKAKIIPLLLKYGANPYKRDGRYHKTSLELANTEHIREIIIVYSGKPYRPNQEDMSVLKAGVEGDKIDPRDKEITYEDKGGDGREKKRGRQITQPKVQKSLQAVNEKHEDNFNEILMESQKNKLFDFLRKIQEYGVQTMQHLAKPSFYSGSWLEEIKTIDDLQRNLNNGTVVEAVLKLFNVLHPYDKTYPMGKGNEMEMMGFLNPEVSNNNNNMRNVHAGGSYQNIDHHGGQSSGSLNQEQEQMQRELMENQKKEMEFLMYIILKLKLGMRFRS